QAGEFRGLVAGEGTGAWREALSQFGEVQELASYLATDVVATADAAQASSVLGTAALALQGLVRGGYRLNLLPRELRATAQRWRNAPTYALVALNLILLTALAARRPLQERLLLRRYEQEIADVDRKATLVDRELK